MFDTSLLEGRIRTYVGVWNGNEPGRGQTQNSDEFFLFGGRLEVAPLGDVPRFEGDYRSAADREKPRFMVGGGALRNRQESKHYARTYVGVDASLWYAGGSLYGELYHRTDRAAGVPEAERPAPITAQGWNLQAGYFPPIHWVREHIELVGRIERFDPDLEVEHPANDAGARDLDQSNPTWGYMGFLVGMNFVWDRAHDLKLQASYEIRNETKRCLEGQSGSSCTGFIDNNLLLVQATAAF